MRSFTYESRVIENERQIKLERDVRKVGNMFCTIVEFCVAFVLFTLINVLLRDLAQNTDLSIVDTCRLIEECACVFFSNTALSGTSFLFRQTLALILAITFTGVCEYGIVVKALGKGDEDREKEQNQHNKREEKPQTVNSYSIVSYRNKVCFLS